MSTRIVNFVEHGAVDCDWFYSVEVPTEIPDADVPLWLRRHLGEFIPYNSRTGDSVDDISEIEVIT